MLSNLWNDLCYAARRLRLSPGFAFATITTIALGIGINTGIFSVLNGLLLRDLPAPDADELVSVYQNVEGEGVQRVALGASSMFSTAEYRTYRSRVRTLSGVMGYSRPRTVTLGGETPQAIRGALVTCNYFDVLRQPVSIGPGFPAGNCEAAGADRTVVLGHDLWTTRFRADPDIVGRQVDLNQQPFTVVGIAAEGVRGVGREPVDFFAPVTMVPLLGPSWEVLDEPNASWLTLVGRRADGASLDQVRAELAVVAAQIDADQPLRRTTLVVSRARPNSLPGARSALFAVGGVVMAAFGLVLLIACANVANLLLARATGRRREVAVRLSLGASRARVVQQLLAESALIALLGGVLGSLLAIVSFQSLVAYALSALPSMRLVIDTSPDLRVYAYALVLTLAAGLLFGLAPALQATRPELHAAMKTDAAGRDPRVGNRLQALLVGAQVAVCMVLMIAAGLLLRGLRATHTVEPGFDYENVVVASFDLGGAGYDTAAATEFQRRLEERVRAVPGVESVAQAAATPLTTDDMEWSARLPGQDQWLPFGFNRVSADYFSLVGVPVVRGRTFTVAEIDGASPAAIVTETTARHRWPGVDPIGQTLTWRAFPGGDSPDRAGVVLRVVGVARDAQITQIGEIPSDYVYLPATPQTQASLQLLLRSRADFAATAAVVRAAVTELDPGLVVRVAPLEANLDVWRSLAGLVGSLSTSLGVLALVLASVGVYGVVAYAVGSRVREIGIRMALGASARDVLALVLRRTMRPIVAGAVIGVAAAFGVSRVLSSVLFGVSPSDPLGLGGAALFVTAVALAVSVLAARPATHADPMTAFRHE